MEQTTVVGSMRPQLSDREITLLAHKLETQRHELAMELHNSNYQGPQPGDYSYTKLLESVRRINAFRASMAELLSVSHPWNEELEQLILSKVAGLIAAAATEPLPG